MPKILLESPPFVSLISHQETGGIGANRFPLLFEADMIKVYMGIDPGKTGAVAMITVRPDMAPVYEVHDLIQNDQNILPVLLSHAVQTRSYKCLLEEIEHNNRWGTFVATKYGAEHGYVRGVLDCNPWVQYSVIRANKWKPHFGLGRDKDKSLELARILLPDHLTRKKDHNRAEAILIAEYLRETDP